MALITTAVTLRSVANILYERYHDDFLSFETISGKSTNDMFRPADYAVHGKGTKFKFKRSMADSFRPSSDALGDFGTSRPFVSEEVELRFNERDSSVNDFVKLSGSVRVSHYQIQEASTAGEGAIVDIVDTLDKDFRRDADFKKAVMRNCDRTCRLGSVNGTKRNNTDLNFASCTTYTAGSTSCRFQVSNGPIGWFREGQIVDVYNSSGTLILDNVQIIDEPNAYDLSVGIQITSETTAAANCDGIATTNEIFWSGSRNQGMFSIGELFNTPGANYIGGVNRTSVNYRGLQGRVFRGSDSAAKVSKAHLDTVGDTIGTQYDKPNVGYSVRLQVALHTAFRASFEQAAFIPWPTNNDGQKRWANYGSTGLTYQHPALGLLKIEADAFMKPGKMQLLAMDEWLAAYYQKKGLTILDGPIGGHWERMESEVPGRGKTLFYQMQGFMNVCDFCTFPRRQLEIQNLTT